jgi:predicted transglutaminase-like cysteine proteinase
MIQGAQDQSATSPAVTEAQHSQTDCPSFMRSVGQCLRGKYRLGDLLVKSHLITPKQLEHALETQRDTQEQLGAVLVREGAISPVQLYRKLAEQWCLRMSAAGVALMVETMTPAAAHADDSLNNVRLAAAFSPAAIKPQAALPGNHLFGSTEIKSTNISAFTKWTSVMKRFEDQMKGSATSQPRMVTWKSALQTLKGKSVREQIDGVNSYINGVRYIEDNGNYGKSDYWATPAEFLARGGDCEDFAIAKYASLRALGFKSDQMRIAIVQDKIKRVAHAVLIVYTKEGTLVLDNQDKRVEFADSITRYKPVFSINSNSWWLHRAAAGA